MCHFTALDNKYDITQSNTSKAWLDKEGNPITQKVDLGSVILDGPLYNETMCLMHTGEARDSISKICVNNIPFILAKIDQPQNGP